MTKEELLKYFEYIESKADIARTHSPEHDQVFNYYCRKIRKIIECYYGTEWIPFTFNDDGLLDCPLPECDEEVLITGGKDVWIDTLMEDNGYYLDSGCEFRGLAWMPLPKPHVKED